MPDDLDPREPSSPFGRNANLAAWLGFFLLVFAVAGIALYVGGSQSVPDGGTPVTTTHNSP